MRSAIILIGLLSNAINTFSQLDRLSVEKHLESEAGTTYRVYAVMKNTGDKVLAVYGDSTDVLTISSTEVFYQNRYGGALSADTRKNMLDVRDSLKYDSWLTIGRTDNYDNNLKTLGIDLIGFEKKGGAITCADGAWYCLPTDKQSISDEKKKILLMQLTTKGVVSGSVSMMGRTASGDNFQQKAVKFSSK